MTRPRTSSGQLSELSQLVLQAHRDNPSATLNELAKATGYSRTAVYYHLNNLQQQGIVIPVRRERASKKNFVKVQKPRPAGDAFRPNAVHKVRAGEQERIEMVVRMAKEKEAAGIIDTGVNIFFDHRVRRVLGRKAG